MTRSFTKFRRYIFTGLALLILLAFAAVGYLLNQKSYIVYADNEILTVSGDYDNVAAVLAAAEIELRAEDLVTPPLSTTIEPGSAIEIQRARPVLVRTDDGQQTIWTLQDNLGALLSEADIVIGRTDQLFADGERVAFNALSESPLPDILDVGRFVTVTIRDGNQEHTLRTSAQTVGEVLQERGVILYAADGVEPPLGQWLTPDAYIIIRRSMPLSIQVDGRLIETRSHHSNALDVLAEAGIGLIGQDFTRPGPETLLQPGNVIEVIRVTEDFRIEDRPIPFETFWQGSDQLELDQRALLSAGQPGLLRQRIRIRYENGVETGQVVDGEWIAAEPVNEVMGYGTNIVMRLLESSGGVYEYWRMVRMRVTSYTAASSGKAPDHPAYGITASGIAAGTGVVAIDPTVVPFRSWVYVPGYGIGYAGDTGGGVKGRWIDLGYDEEEFVSWSGYVDVYYLAPIPDPDRVNYQIPTWLP